MKKAVKAMWVDAILSNVYKQGHGALGSCGKDTPQGFDDEQYTKDENTPLTTSCKYNCCLGVLTDIYVSVTGKVPERGSWTDPSLPLEVVEWAGLEEDDPIVVIDDVPVKISLVNDGGIDWDSEKRIKPHSFKKIAEIIEAQL